MTFDLMNGLKKIILTSGLLFVTACVDTGHDAKIPKGADEVIVVGKFEISPPIPRHVDDAAVLPGGAKENSVLTAFLPYLKNQPRTPNPLEFEGRATFAPLDQNFYVSAERGPLVLQSGWYFPYIGTYGSASIQLPGGLTTQSPAGADIVYVGTIVFERDEFHAITGVRVKDEFQSTLPEIRNTLGSDVKIEKSLVR